ncbi:MAG: hypothetical protein KDC54_02655 [Lewinella sp.]|nr:hypothetical protein [Lewinella sp.]
MRALIIALSLLSLSVLSGQTYIVLTVEGKIYNGDKLLEPRDRLEHDTELRFAEAQAEAYLMSLSKGYFLLKANDQHRRSGNEFFSAVKDALLPPNEFHPTAMRTSYQPGESFVIEDEWDLRDFMRGDLFLLDTLFIPIPTEDMLLDPTDHLRITWRLEGVLPLEEEYPIRNGQIALTLPDGAALTDQPVQANLLYPEHYEADEMVITTFQLRRLSPEALRVTLQRIYAISEEQRPAYFFMEAALPYLQYHYGKTNPEQLWEWMLEEVMD